MHLYMGAWVLLSLITPTFFLKCWFYIGAYLISNVISFKHIAKWFIYTYTHIYSFSNSFPIRLLQNIEQSSLPIQQVLVDYFKCSSIYKSILNSQSIRPLLPPQSTFCRALFHQLSMSFSCSSSCIFVIFSPCIITMIIGAHGFNFVILLFVFYLSLLHFIPLFHHSCP